MAKMTLLEMTQNILSAMDSDSVNSISDTVESTQVADTIKESYMRLMSERDWPFLRSKSSLTASGSVLLPTKMTMPDNLSKLLWVRYNKKPVSYLDPESFQVLLDTRVEAAGVVDANGYVLNQDPTYWTTFDDNVVWFDSYDSSVDSTLQQSKCVVYGVTSATWVHTDVAVPFIPEKYFPTLLAEAKAACFLNIKQQGNNREEANAKRGRTRMQNEAWRADAGESTSNSRINYGRHGGGVTMSRKNKFAA